MKQKFLENLKEQLEVLNLEANHMINLIKRSKETTEDQIKFFCKNQLEIIDECKNSLSSNMSYLNNLITGIVRISKLLEGITIYLQCIIDRFHFNFKTFFFILLHIGKKELIYDDIIEEKKTIIQEWEIFLKNFKLPSFNFSFIETKIDHLKIINIDNSLFSFTKTKYPETTIAKNDLNENAKSNHLEKFNLLQTQAITISKTPCNSNSKIFFLSGTVSTNANTNANSLNFSKINSYRKVISPDNIPGKNAFSKHFRDGSPNNKNNQAHSPHQRNFNICLNNLNNRHSLEGNANNNINSKNFPLNKANLIMNSLDDKNIRQQNNGNHIKNHYHNNIPHPATKLSKDDIIPIKNDSKEINSFQPEKQKRSNSSITKKLANKQISINVNPNLLHNNHRLLTNIPATTNRRSQDNPQKPQTKNLNNCEDSNDSIRDIIKNLNEDKLYLNFNRKPEKPCSTFKISGNLQKKDSTNVNIIIKNS